MCPREFISHDGSPMPESKRLKTEQTYIDSGVEEYADLETSDEKRDQYYSLIKNAFSKIDLNKVRYIFEKIGERCGIKAKDLNFLKLDRITLTLNNKTQEGGDLLGIYHPLSNRIALSARGILKDAWVLTDHPKEEKGIVINRDALEISTLAKFIHEQIHAISYTRIEESNENASIEKNNIFIQILNFVREQPASLFKSVKSGYAENKSENNVPKGEVKYTKNYEVFDEAVTEKLSLEILREYLQQVSLENLKHNQIENFIDRLEKESHYSEYIKLLNYIIESISRTTKISERDVWQAIVRGKLEGVNMDDPEIKEFYWQISDQKNI
ncbi:MAG: hypothetical protein Q8P32_02055 [Candidatus Komeilibacteria bacterium]|nr:hypothetical protein [Candidatus Komeilibacteria bacterium]